MTSGQGCGDLTLAVQSRPAPVMDTPIRARSMGYEPRAATSRMSSYAHHQAGRRPIKSTMRTQTIMAWTVAAIVPFLMIQPTFAGFVSDPTFMGQQWDTEDGNWWAMMNGSLSLAYLAWITRWALASNISWAPRAAAILLLLPGSLLSSYFTIVAVGTTLGSPASSNDSSNEPLRDGVFIASAVSFVCAVLLIVLDHRRSNRPALA